MEKKIYKLQSCGDITGDKSIHEWCEGVCKNGVNHARSTRFLRLPYFYIKHFHCNIFG